MSALCSPLRVGHLNVLTFTQCAHAQGSDVLQTPQAYLSQNLQEMANIALFNGVPKVSL